MQLSEQIDIDLKSALKEKQEVALSALRNLKAAVKNVEIEKGQPLSEEEVVAVVSKKVKQHKDSIDSFKSGGREDLVAGETAQMEILQRYMPKQMDESEITSIVKETIAVLNATAADFGKVMKEVSAKTRGKADGSLVSKIVKENLK